MLLSANSHKISESSVFVMLPYLVRNTICSYGATDIGLVRQNNEDVWAQVSQIGLYMLADGMGGHQAGEVAARETINALLRIFRKRMTNGELSSLDLDQTLSLLKRAIIYVNGRIFKMGRSQEGLKGMGTTLCCLLFYDENLIIAHVGDSRIYRLRDAQLEQMTKDHSLLCDLVDQGQISNRHASDFAYKNIITKAIGTEPRIEPSVSSIAVQKGDVYMMCTDGLSDFVETSEMEHVLANSTTLESATEHLIALANLRGGRDNITVVLTRVDGYDAKNLS